MRRRNHVRPRLRDLDRRPHAQDVIGRRRRQGTRCITVHVNEDELSALIVRNYLAEDARRRCNGDKKGDRRSNLRRCVRTSSSRLHRLDLAFERRRPDRNLSQVEEQFGRSRVTAKRAGPVSDRHVSQGCRCRASEPLPPVFDGSAAAWTLEFHPKIMRKKLPLCSLSY